MGLSKKSNKNDYFKKNYYQNSPRGDPRGVMHKALDYGIIVNEFERQSRNYVHFQTKYSWEKYEHPLSPTLAMGLIVPLMFFEKDGFRIK